MKKVILQPGKYRHIILGKVTIDDQCVALQQKNINPYSIFVRLNQNPSEIIEVSISCMRHLPEKG